MAELPQYVPEDAAKIVFENITPELKAKLSQENVYLILEIEFEFLEQSGVTKNPDSIVPLPIAIDDKAMKYYIINQCTKEDILLTYEEVKEILEAETIYMQSIGIIDDEGMAPFYN